jgi:hypothetical protein
VDTVEWGTGEQARRRLTPLRFAVPRVGGLALAAAGFALLVAAEIVPWASVQNTAANTARTAVIGNSELVVGLDRITASSGYTYHFGVIVLLGAVGLVLASPPARRRLAMGVALGVAAGQALMVVAVTRSALRTFDTLTALVPSRSGSTLSFQATLGVPDTGYRVVLGQGVYLASAAVLLLAAATVAAGLLQRGALAPARAEPVETSAPIPAESTEAPDGAAPAAQAQRWRRPAAPVEAPDDERELTVTPLEPMDESYFARE